MAHCFRRTASSLPQIPVKRPRNRSTLILYGVLGLAALIVIICTAAVEKGSEGGNSQRIGNPFPQQNKTDTPEGTRKNSSPPPSSEPSMRQEPTNVAPAVIASSGSNSLAPTDLPALLTYEPSNFPSSAPTNSTAQPSVVPVTEKPSPKPYERGPDEVVTTILAIGDVPYSLRDQVLLRQQIESLDTRADFLIHVGDTRTGKETKCDKQDYIAVDEILMNSAVPVFIVPGDNEWNDCSKPDKGWKMWSQYFMNYPDTHWKDQHSFIIERQPNRPENFSFVHKGSLFIGLNLVGGLVHDANEWKSRLTEQAQWTMQLMRQHRLPTTIFGHADPRREHNDYFLTIRNFIRDELQNAIPVMYINGDAHKWMYNRTFLGQQSWERITLVGGVSERPLLVEIDSSQDNPNHVFRYQR